MKKLYVNNECVLEVKDIKNEIIIETEQDETFTLQEYIEFTLQSNLDYDGISLENKIEWRNE
jgi:hypothetical protein